MAAAEKFVHSFVYEFDSDAWCLEDTDFQGDAAVGSYTEMSVVVLYTRGVAVLLLVVASLMAACPFYQTDQSSYLCHPAGTFLFGCMLG